MNPLCKIWGHKFDQSEGWSGPFPCTRCSHVFDPYEYTYEKPYKSGSLELGFYLWRLREFFRRKEFQRYFQKCPDCGKRFNKHGLECPPF